MARAVACGATLTSPIASQWVPFLSRYAGEDTRQDAGETGDDPGAEGATAPETLRQKDRVPLMNSGEQWQSRHSP